jgi:hypothetical protein
MITARRSITLVVLAALLVFSASASTQDFDRGFQAYERGDMPRP